MEGQAGDLSVSGKTQRLRWVLPGALKPNSSSVELTVSDPRQQPNHGTEEGPSPCVTCSLPARHIRQTLGLAPERHRRSGHGLATKPHLEKDIEMERFIEPVAYDAVERFDLRDRIALVTGGAHGLGLAIATAFLGAGAKVGILDLDGEALEARAPEMAARGKVVTRAVDIRDDAAVQAAVEDIATELGGMDILVNDAAIFPTGPLAQTESQTLTAALDVNVVGYLRTVTAALPYLRASGRGRIINFGSVTFFLGHPDGLGAYIATKGAVTGLTRALAREVGVDGITANILAPGAFPTRAEHGVHEDQAAFDRQVIDVQSIKRRGEVNDIATAALFLASDAGSFITGQTLLVDGGWTFN